MAIIKVDCSDLDDNPKCTHGPTIKFTRIIKGSPKSFFACSAYRSRKDCQFFLWENEALSSTKKQHFDNLRKKARDCIDHLRVYNEFKGILSLAPKDRRYCLSCHKFYKSCETSEHINHDGFNNSPISQYSLLHPSTLLTPKAENKKEAQYWFSNSSVEFITSLIKSSGSQKVICIGSPRIHEVNMIQGVESLLLDIDSRFHTFYSPENFCWYNMFSNYFLGDKCKGKNVLNNFICGRPISIVIDPPFGARLEGLARTLHTFRNSYLAEHSTSKDLYIFLILPYFMKPKVDEMDLELEMVNFCVEYENHRFKRSSGGSQKSPVRLFSNFKVRDDVATSVGGTICNDCGKLTTFETKHCFQCGTCPNGSTFWHCDVCGRCVKKSWKHCKVCNRCCVVDHLCQQVPIKFKKRKK